MIEHLYDYVIRELLNTKLKNNFLFRECLSGFCSRNDGAEVRSNTLVTE